MATTNKRNSRNRKTMKKGGAKKKPLPTSSHAAIKRAKKAIQDLILNPSEEKRAIAKEEIDNANKRRDSNRTNWEKETLIIPHYGLCPSSWYCKTNEVQWSLNKMPDWAKSGKLEPKIGETVHGHAYTTPPKSQSR
jgi:hypothetical protein